MIKSAAIIKNAPRAEWREVRLAKKKAKKQAQIERKAIKVHFPSPMNVRVREPVEEIEVVEVFEIIEVAEVAESLIVSDAPPTREEMAIKARELGIKFDGRTSNKKLSSLIATALGG
jgi:ribosomal protein L32E